MEKCWARVAAVCLSAFSVRGTGLPCDFVLGIQGATTADAAFSGKAALLAQQHATRAAGRQSMFRWMIYPAQTDHLALPQTIESDDAGGFAEWKTVHRPAMYVYCIAKGLYHGDRGAVIDSQQRVLSDLLDAPPGPLHEPLIKTKPSLCSGNAMVLSSSRNHFHWLIKMLPRLHLLEQVGVLPARVDAVFINDPTAAQAEGYARARLAGRSLRIVGSRDFWCCSRLYVSSIPHDIPMWAVTFLRQLFGPVPPANNARAVYLMRGATRRRRVQNESDILRASDKTRNHSHQSWPPIARRTNAHYRQCRCDRCTARVSACEPSLRAGRYAVARDFRESGESEVLLDACAASAAFLSLLLSRRGAEGRESE